MNEKIVREYLIEISDYMKKNNILSTDNLDLEILYYFYNKYKNIQNQYEVILGNYQEGTVLSQEDLEKNLLEDVWFDEDIFRYQDI